MATMAPAPPTSMVPMPMPVPPASPGPLSSRAPAVLPAGAVGAAVQPGGGGASSLSVSCSLGIAGGGNGNEVGGGNGNGVGSDSAHPTRWGPPQPLSDAVVAAGIPPSDGAVLSRSTFADDALRRAGLYPVREGSATLAAKHEPSRQDPSKQGDDSQVSRVNALLLRTNSQLQRQITTLQRENHTLKWQMQTSTLQQANETLQQQNSILVAETSALQGQTAEMRWLLSEQETALRFMQARLSSGRWSELTPGAISFESSVFRRLYDTTTAPRRARIIRRCLSCMLRSHAARAEIDEGAWDDFFYAVTEHERRWELDLDRDLSEETLKAYMIRLWTDPVKLYDRHGHAYELCMILNEALRTDMALSPEVVMLVRALNRFCCRKPHSQPLPTVSYRGGGLPTLHRDFFQAGRQFRAPMFIATSANYAVALKFTTRVVQKEHPVLWTFRIPPACRHGVQTAAARTASSLPSDA